MRRWPAKVAVDGVHRCARYGGLAAMPVAALVQVAGAGWSAWTPLAAVFAALPFVTVMLALDLWSSGARLRADRAALEAKCREVNACLDQARKAVAADPPDLDAYAAEVVAALSRLPADGRVVIAAEGRP